MTSCLRLQGVPLESSQVITHYQRNQTAPETIEQHVAGITFVLLAYRVTATLLRFHDKRWAFSFERSMRVRIKVQPRFGSYPIHPTRKIPARKIPGATEGNRVQSLSRLNWSFTKDRSGYKIIFDLL